MTFTNAQPLFTRLECPNQCQGSNIEQAEVFHDEYYIIDGHYLEWQGFVAVRSTTTGVDILLLIGVFVMYQAHSSSHDNV